MGELIDDLLALDEEVLPDYINNQLPVVAQSNNWNLANAQPGRLYHIQCDDHQTFQVPDDIALSRIAIVSDCLHKDPQARPRPGELLERVRAARNPRTAPSILGIATGVLVVAALALLAWRFLGS